MKGFFDPVAPDGTQHNIITCNTFSKACACATCHVIVREGFESLPPSEEKEDDLLDRAWGLDPKSRLSCQAIVDKKDLVI
ncbi:MAG: 2Fe-2S iron-sulfur cluster binding domain-containing protein [Methylotenera sp.]|nr:2Fe-2S iron-sulfur cluster binding domain-containing protein [Methylotenera sp.]NOT65076.1 2Fe-2S iron-sulfur cluster binding domain-containing protein [Methylotenera sp.]